MHVLPNPQVPIGLPSPTLTNPDMILPHSLPSPDSSAITPQNLEQLQSAPTAQGRLERSASAVSERPRIKGTMSPFQNGILRHHDGSMRLRSSFEKGGKRVATEQSRSYQVNGHVVLDSSSMIREDHNGIERTSYAEDSIEEDDLTESRKNIYRTPSILDEDEDDPNSHAAMTRRAEEILANAKKRLTNMEGNLNRARSTLESGPPSSMSSFDKCNKESVSLYTIPGRGRNLGGFSPAKHRQGGLPALDETKQGHFRVSSETSVPSTLQTNLPHGHTKGDDGEGALRGLGISGLDVASRDRHSEPGRNWFWNGLTRNTSLNYAGRHNNSLQPLNEDGPAPASFKHSQNSREDIEEEETVDLSSPTVARFNIQHPPQTNGLSRARSTTQMHDLREQMSDLKGKISSLKQRAREDNLRRRSLQSLRTPSPFTEAPEQWYVGNKQVDHTTTEHEPAAKTDLQPREDEKGNEAEALQDSGHASPVPQPIERAIDETNATEAVESSSPDPEDLALTDSPHPEDGVVPTYASRKGRLVLGGPEFGTTEPMNRKPRLIIQDDISPVKVVFESEALPESIAEPESADTSNESWYEDDDFQDSSTTPVIERHEDRPDAFDYKHFVLHSAMGSYSGVGMRRSSSMRKRASSESSASSVETAKARTSVCERPDSLQLNSQDNTVAHGRQNSVDSVSTTDTFATADEGQDRLVRSPHQIPDHPKKHKGSPETHSPTSPRKSRVKHISTAQKVMMNGTPPLSPPTETEKPPDVLSYLATMAPKEESVASSKLQLGERDKELVERLVNSLAKVCGHVHELGPEGSKYEARVFRRKLDAARRVLDGEMNGEAF